MTDQEKKMHALRLVLNMQREARMHGEDRASIDWVIQHPTTKKKMEQDMVLATGDLLQFIDELIGGFHDDNSIQEESL
jgi:hypothetical protein